MGVCKCKSVFVVVKPTRTLGGVNKGLFRLQVGFLYKKIDVDLTKPHCGYVGRNLLVKYGNPQTFYRNPKLNSRWFDNNGNYGYADSDLIEYQKDIGLVVSNLVKDSMDYCLEYSRGRGLAKTVDMAASGRYVLRFHNVDNAGCSIDLFALDKSVAPSVYNTLYSKDLYLFTDKDIKRLSNRIVDYFKSVNKYIKEDIGVIGYDDSRSVLLVNNKVLS